MKIYFFKSYFIYILQSGSSLHSFKVGKFYAAVDWNVKEKNSFVDGGDYVSIFDGCIGITNRDVSRFIFRTRKTKCFYRIFVQMKFQGSEVFEDVIQNTSVRFSTVKSSVNRVRRSNKMQNNSTILQIDQFHVLNKFQRQGIGARVLSLLFLWTKLNFPFIKKCVVISPSSIGKPFYIALGATQEIASSNLEFDL